MKEIHFSFNLSGPDSSTARVCEIVRPIVKKERLYKQVIEELVNYIDKNSLELGDQLPSERTLSSMLNVSRTTVKEAMSVLEANGFVHIKQGVGVFLAAANNEQFQQEVNDVLANQKGSFRDIFELRQAIEGDAAYYAAKRITEEQKEQFTKLYRNLAEAEQRGEDAVEEDLQFHMAIARASNNTLVYEVMKLLSNRMKVFLMQNRAGKFMDTKHINDVSHEHKEIFEMIINGNSERAKAAMWSHLQSIKRRHEHEWSELEWKNKEE